MSATEFIAEGAKIGEEIAESSRARSPQLARERHRPVIRCLLRAYLWIIAFNSVRDLCQSSETVSVFFNLLKEMDFVYKQSGWDNGNYIHH